MEILSPVFGHEQNIPAKYTCDGDDINPPLIIKDIPVGTQSLVLIVEDPDAPAGTWTHWTLWNISPAVKEISEGTVPEGAVQGKNTSGQAAYEGPCPPTGTHRYFFKLYALDAELPLEPGSPVADLQTEIEAHTMDSAELIGLYGRNQ